MICLEGFDSREAKHSGICADCKSKFCPEHPEHLAWRIAEGLLPKLAQVFEPVISIGPALGPIVFQPKSVGGFKRGRTARDYQTSSLIGNALKTMCNVAETILKEEGLYSEGWRAVSKRGVWATHCNYSKRRVQFGEGSALCHLEGGHDLVMKEMERFAWEKTPENGWLMIVLHEVAHAVDKKVNAHSGHGPLFHRVLVSLRAKYFTRLIGMFSTLRSSQRVAADSLK